LVKNGNEIILSISYNYSRKESSPEFYSEDDLRDQIKSNKLHQFQLIAPSDLNFEEALKDLNNGKQLWKFFIFLAIIFLFCEMAIIRFWK